MIGGNAFSISSCKLQLANGMQSCRSVSFSDLTGYFVNSEMSSRYKKSDGAKRSSLIISRGEGRSANRSKWTKVEDQEEGTSAKREIMERSDLDTSLNLTEFSIWDCVDALREEFDAIDRLVSWNSQRVQDAFRKNKVGPHHFQGSTGYGHGDLGRSTMDDIMASIMGAEAAAVRIQFVSGTHAIAAGLFSCLRPGDELVAVAGHPYDTLEEVIGVRGIPNAGSLCDFGVSYRVLELTSSGTVDFEALQMAIRPGMDLIGNICIGYYTIARQCDIDYY